MGLFDRMGRVISSNFNAIIDKAEDPRKSIELTLEEMREQIRLGRKEVVSAVAAEKQLKKKVEELDQQAEKWSQRAELAVKHGDDALAREALVQKRRIVDDRDRAEAFRAEQRGSALEMKAELERMEKKLGEYSARKGTLALRAEQVKAGSSSVESLGRSAPGGAFEEFRRMEDQIEAVETTVQAQREVEDVLVPKGPTGLSSEEIEAKFRALEGGAQPAQSGAQSPVEEELEALKKKIRVST